MESKLADQQIVHCPMSVLVKKFVSFPFYFCFNKTLCYPIFFTLTEHIQDVQTSNI